MQKLLKTLSFTPSTLRRFLSQFEAGANGEGGYCGTWSAGGRGREGVNPLEKSKIFLRLGTMKGSGTSLAPFPPSLPPRAEAPVAFLVAIVSMQSSVSVTFLWLLQLAVVPTVAVAILAFVSATTDFHATDNCPPRLENDLDYNAKDRSVVNKPCMGPTSLCIKFLEPKRGVGPGPRKMGPGWTRWDAGGTRVGACGTRWTRWMGKHGSRIARRQDPVLYSAPGHVL